MRLQAPLLTAVCLIVLTSGFQTRLAQAGGEESKTGAALKEVQALQRQQNQLAAELQKSRTQLENTQQALNHLVKIQTEIQQQLKAGQQQLMEQLAQVETEKKRLLESITTEAAAKATLEAAQKNYAAANTERSNLQQAVDAKLVIATQSQMALASVEQQNLKLQADTGTLSKSRHELELLIQKQQQTGKQSAAAEDAMWKGIEKLARSDGTWVSFSQQIAPILHRRCLACHNDGKPRGQLVMDSYAFLMRGGESGPLVDFARPELSTLVAMIEDGSMPKDDDPLTPEQISLFHRWVTLGARLDANAAATASLIELMPRPEPPRPPQDYPVAVPVHAAALHASGSLLATSGYHEVLIWNTSDGTLRTRIPGLPERVFALEFLEDTFQLAVATGTPGEVGEIKILEAESGKLLQNLAIFASVPTALKFSPDAARLAVCGVDGMIHLFETSSWNRVASIHAHSDWVNQIAWSPDGTLLASASRDKTAKVFDVATGGNVVSFHGHTDSVTSVMFLAGGQELASGSDDKRLRIWNVSDAKEVRNVTGYGGALTSIVQLADGTLLTASLDNKLRIHAAADSKIVKTLSGPTAGILCLATAPDGNIFVTGSLSGEITRWSLAVEKPTLVWLAQPTPSKVAPEQPAASPAPGETK